MIRTIDWQDDSVVMLDQKALPEREIYVPCRDYDEVCAAIRDMTVRGAPAIGIAAAMGAALGFLRHGRGSKDHQRETVERVCGELAATRPTAANLFRALERVKERFRKCAEDDFESTAAALKEEAMHMLEEDIKANRAMGRLGCGLVPPGSAVLTHCNAGALATGGYGTALGIVRAAHEAGRNPRVFADETRPLLQGSRLTAWEMVKEGIPVTVITDSAAGSLMASGEVDLVLVGADRIAANGDTANKIGTYPLALLAHEHGIPFYVAAPTSTIDTATSTGKDIPIEERGALEVLTIAGRPTAPAVAKARNPAFDVTPHRLITAIITERGILREPFDRSIVELMENY